MEKTITSWTKEKLEFAKDVLARSHTVAQAAGELGVSYKSLARTLGRHGLKASEFLLKPEHRQTVPDGHRLRGNSTLLDENDEPTKRWVKTERASDDPPAFEAVPPGFLVKKVSTLLDGQGQVRAQWIQAPKDEQNKWEQFWEACASHTEKYSGLAEPTPAPKASENDLLTMIALGDPHIGMLSWHRETGQDFDSKIAERDLIKVVDMLVDRAPASRIGVLANVGDFYHADNSSQLTPSGGNKLDVDSRWTKIMELGFSVMRRMIDRLLQKHDEVIVVNVPGNHDPLSARMLNFWVKAVYERENRVTVLDNASSIMYLRHGKNFFGFAHGDRMKIEQMPGVMAADRPKDWGETLHRLWVTGHVHHLTRKEFPGCVVESFRTLATSDEWHIGMGYRSQQSLCSMTFDKEWGEISRSTVDLRFARASC